MALPGRAQTYTVLASTAGAPSGRLTYSDGLLFGAIASGNGVTTATLFRLRPDGTDMRQFQDLGSGEVYLLADGSRLYGAMSVVGSSSGGRLFCIGTNGENYTVFQELYSSGAFPRANLIQAGSILYGTTERAGYIYGDGAVFKIQTNGTGYTVLRILNDDQRKEGRYPRAGLVLLGNTLYGTAYSGGLSNCGTIFRINTDGTQFEVLRSFVGADGKNPKSDLVAIGNVLYGTTSAGGPSNHGTLFRLNTDGTEFTLVYDFAATANGAGPATGLVRDGDLLYGTTGSPATIFEIRTDGSGYTVLQQFPSADGMKLQPLLLVGHTLYGAGAATHYNQVFSLSLEPPRITTVPTNLTAWSGTSVDLSVDATGAQPMAYQWRLNGASLPDRTQAALHLSNVRSSDGGPYTVVITNRYGAVTSSPIQLAILDAGPVLDLLPTNRSVPIGDTVDFSVAAHGSLPLTFQWYFNTTHRLDAEVHPTLSLTNVQPAQAGSYRVVVANAFGSVTSPPALLTVTGIPPVLLTQPRDRSAALGATADFAAAAAGTPPLSYQWYFNGTNTLLWGTSPTLHLAQVQAAQAGTYHVVVTNLYGTATSAPALLTVAPPAPVSECTELALRSAMALGGTVTFACDGVINVTNTLTNAFDTVLDGTGHAITLSGQGALRVLYVNTNTHLRLVNLTVADGLGSSNAVMLQANSPGGGLYNDGGWVELVGVTFRSNNAAGGGALFSQGGTVAATNCLFAGNLARRISITPIEAQGGAVLALDSQVVFEDCVFSANRAAGADGFEFPAAGAAGTGGALCTSGTLHVNRCSFLGNAATAGNGFNSPNPSYWEGPGTLGGNAKGGALYHLGAVTIDCSLFLSNAVVGGRGGDGARGNNDMDPPFYSARPGTQGGPGGDAWGGALYHLGAGLAVNCTFGYNRAAGGDGGPGGPGGSGLLHGDPAADGGPGGNGGLAIGAVAGGLKLLNCTVAFNAGSRGIGGAGGAGGSSVGGRVGVAGPSGTSGEARGGITMATCQNTLLVSNLTGNCYSSVADRGHNLSSDATCNFPLRDVDARLGPLGQYGGPTLTFELLPDSPAIDAADAADAPKTDQRGLPRFTDAGVDIGAFEYGAIPRLRLASSAPGAGLDLEAWGTRGRTFCLWMSTDLVHWAPVATNQIDTSGICCWHQAPSPDATARFYRISMP